MGHFVKGRKRTVTVLTVIAAVILSAAAVFLYGIRDPGTGILYPKCLFFMFTGLECPGCGSQRAIHSLLNGDIAAAVHYNALTVAAIPYIAVYLTTVSLQALKVPEKTRAVLDRIRGALSGGVAIRVILVIIILFWVFRNFTDVF